LKILIIGAQGFVGARLRKHLEARGASVVAVSSRDGSGLCAASGLLPETFRVADGVEAVVYLAASPRFREAPASAAHIFSVNALSAITAAEQARRAGAKRFVYASTGNVYAPSFAPCAEDAPLRRDDWYALSKVQAEEALALFRPYLGVHVGRLFGVYGPGQKDRLVPNIAASLRAGRAIELQPQAGVPEDTDGLRISLCFVDDVADVLARLALEGGPVCLNFASDEVLSVRAITEALGAALGTAPRYVRAERPRASDLIADNTLLRTRLAPRFTPFAEGIALTAAARD
jgi:UDP-glucose 4-epimerase